MSEKLSKMNSLEHYSQNLNRMENILRTDTFSQPRALKNGDVLSNDLILKGAPYNDNLQGISLMFQNVGNMQRFIPPRIPLQLAGGDHGVLPQDLRVGDVLQTGCVVLEAPILLKIPKHRNKQLDVSISLSGTTRPAHVAVPNDIEIAVFGDPEDLEGASDLLRSLVTEKLLAMRKSTLRSLAHSALFESML